MNTLIFDLKLMVDVTTLEMARKPVKIQRKVQQDKTMDVVSNINICIVT